MNRFSLMLTKNERRALAALALFGLVVPNGLFLHVFFNDAAAMRAALANPVALLFMAEAFGLTLLLAWLLHRLRWKRPGGLLFIVLSLAGSLAFSVPLTLFLAAREKGQEPEVRP